MFRSSYLYARIRFHVCSPLDTAGRLARQIGLQNVVPAGWGKFPRSRLATRRLGTLKGIEIGGSAPNAFGLDTRNVDVVDHQTQQTPYAREQLRFCGEIMPVDIIAPGNDLPMRDEQEEFVIASHVIEHFYDPISAILEWVRVAERFVLIIAPHRDRTPDRTRDVTSIEELVSRYQQPKETHPTEDTHWSVWRTEDFVRLIEFLGLPIDTVQDVDDKVGNGFAVLIGDLE